MNTNTNTEEWGNIELPGLSDEKLFKTNWYKVAANYERWNDPEFVKRRDIALKKAMQDPKVRENVLKAQKKFRTEEFKENHAKIMHELFQTEEWRKAVEEANADPKRNNKISKALSIKVKSPNKTYNSINEAAKDLGLTSEAIRYRCKNVEGWEYLSESKASESKRKNHSESSKKTSEQRLIAIAKKKGFIQTQYGVFLSLKDAWREESKFVEKIPPVPFIWFQKMSKEFPETYKKITLEEYIMLTGKDI